MMLAAASLSDRRGRRERLGRPTRRPRRACCWLTGAHLLLSALAACLVLGNPPGSDLADTVVSVPQWGWLPLPLALVIACLVARRRLAAALNVLALIALGLSLSGFSVGALRPVQGAQGSELRIVTWNVHNMYTRTGAIRSRLLGYQPDIVFLQEASDRQFGGLLPGWQEASSTSLRLYSRRPLEQWSWPDHMVPVFRRWLPGTVQLEGVTQLRVLNVHLHSRAGGHSVIEGEVGATDYLKWRERLQQQQFREIAQVTVGVGPVIACGDFNAPPTASLHRALRATLTDAFSARGFGFGMTYLLENRLPMWRIDYVWCGGGVQPIQCFAGGAYPSDHRPVVADVVVPSQAAHRG